MCKTLRTQNFRAPRFSWYSFGNICTYFQPSHIKNHEFQFFHKTPHQATYAVVHRQPWPCAKPSELKTFMHQEFHGIHLGTFVGLSNPHISKITNFILSQNSPPSQLCRRAPPTLAMCKTLRTQNFRAPRFSRYSFGDICRPFQPSHLKNHEFHFFIKIPNQPIKLRRGAPTSLPCANPSKLIIFMHQELNGLHLGTFLGLSNPHISKTTNFIFSQNSPPTNQVMTSCTDKLAMCKPLRTQNYRAPRISWYSFGDICRPFQPSHLKNHEFHFFTKLPPSHKAMPLCTDQLGQVTNPPNSKLSCTKNFMVFIWGHL